MTGSQETFTQLYEYRLLLLGGYAIIDDASFPIVGDPKRAYDTYMDQLVADAKAAVDEAVRLGVATSGSYNMTSRLSASRVSAAPSGKRPMSTSKCRHSSPPTN